MDEIREDMTEKELEDWQEREYNRFVWGMVAVKTELEKAEILKYIAETSREHKEFTRDEKAKYKTVFRNELLLDFVLSVALAGVLYVIAVSDIAGWLKYVLVIPVAAGAVFLTNSFRAAFRYRKYMSRNFDRDMGKALVRIENLQERLFDEAERMGWDVSKYRSPDGGNRAGFSEE